MGWADEGAGGQARARTTRTARFQAGLERSSTPSSRGRLPAWRDDRCGSARRSSVAREYTGCKSPIIEAPGKTPPKKPWPMVPGLAILNGTRRRVRGASFPHLRGSPSPNPLHEEVSMKLQRSPLLVLLGLALAAGATLWGCGRQDRLGSPVGVELCRTSTPTVASSQALRATMDAQMRATPAPLRTDGVVGTATGVDASGHPALLVLTERGLGAGRLPAIFEIGRAHV